LARRKKLNKINITRKRTKLIYRKRITKLYSPMLSQKESRRVSSSPLKGTDDKSTYK